MILDFHKIKLTKLELDIFGWAADPCNEFFLDKNERDYAGEPFYDDDIAFIKNGIAYLVKNNDVIEDMIYRIGTQLEAMSGEHMSHDGLNDNPQAKSILRLTPKIVEKLEQLNTVTPVAMSGVIK